ncbi:DUF4188 domain-containing protein [Streptomyces sp. H10-C2]|uniref:DUF4188 domain-containing protein n=1 Tax=unclassified Streptomyces TaxID=2593676 RepID=UPI0024B973E4|nr:MULTISPECIES: DUF4188 domain-containing protein [unclassified Streptomyces]MDJ0341676.1 DUF4188 domain-containing protein [Streptomyces sp. PH10-H1]MDJ0369016.1 DUF4188 domain-containing protein [Streptomyces sp. H10-C2]
MTAKPIEGRTTADAGGEVIVFIIGMRINNFLAVRSWWPVFTAMPRMLKELSGEKGSGLLGFRGRPGFPRVFEVIQYWESREKLLAYASDQNGEHRPAWAAFNRRARAGKNKVGFFHETYVVPVGGHESIYVNMPEYGLGEATGVVPVGRRGESAADRLAYRAG